MGYIDLSVFLGGTFVEEAMEGDCNVCGRRRCLYYGACFDCSNKVAGRPIPGGHELWEKDRP